MGAMFVVLTVIVILAILVTIIYRKCKKGSKFHTLVMKIRAKIFWNSMLRFVLQSYLKVAIGTLFSIYLINTDTSGDIANTVFAIIVLLILIIFPIFFAIVLHRNRSSLDSQELRDRIGTLYLGINVTTVY